MNNQSIGHSPEALLSLLAVERSFRCVHLKTVLLAIKMQPCRSTWSALERHVMRTTLFLKAQKQLGRLTQ